MIRTNYQLSKQDESYGDFIDKYIKAMKIKSVMRLLKADFNEAIDNKVAPIHENISKMQEVNKLRDEWMDTMERKLDKYEHCYTT